MTTNQWHMLVVEDDADGQEMMRTLLGHLNVSTDIASDVAEAEHLLFTEGRVYNAAIIDLALPDKDGWQLLAEIRANPATSQLPCVAVTAFHTSKLREDAILAGFKAYFPKPVDGIALLRGLESIM
jgi:CheY-like chemotaxis protein